MAILRSNIKGPKGEYDIPVYTRSGNGDYTGCPTWDGGVNQNCLKASGDYSASVYQSNYNNDSKYRYILAKNKNDNEGTSVGFYMLATDYSRVTTVKEGDVEIGTTVYYHYLAPHKAYLETDLQITPKSPTRGLELDFGDGTTAILKVTNDNNDRIQSANDNAYYTLQGVRVQTPSKGLYILNGKKVLVK